MIRATVPTSIVARRRAAASAAATSARLLGRSSTSSSSSSARAFVLPRSAASASVAAPCSSPATTNTSSSFSRRERRRRQRQQCRAYNFASTGYASCFEDDVLPRDVVVNTDELRRDALVYLEKKFDARSWYDEPVCSILNGEKLLAPPPYLWITKNSLDEPNGHQYFATPEQVDTLLNHVLTYTSPHSDLRSEIRRIESRLLGREYAGLLIGNQCVDFAKQDGVTEIEESIMANSVERRMNDMLFDDERDGKIVVSRRPIFVSCVSNFSNFLDLSRKILRSLEFGIPCVILSRSHTTQHPYRWAELLVNLIREEGIDPGMVTYLSCQLEDIVHITSRCAGTAGNLYTTCSRELARSIKSTYPDTVSSTGGPNTLLTTGWTGPVRDAIRTSASIECAGQCTALRHLVVPESVRSGDVESVFDDVEHVSCPIDALKRGAFDGVFDGHGGGASPPPPDASDYSKHGRKDAYFKVGRNYPSPENDEMNEYWRRVVVDVTNSLPEDDDDDDDDDGRLGAEVEKLSRWLIRHQPISLAVNAKRARVLRLGRDLFDRTSLVVTTIGSTDDADAPPAMTCQARPQDAECFGEFPPRKRMGEYTKFPVIIPSSTPSYDACYREEYLASRTLENLDGTGCPGHARDWLSDVADPAARGYCVELVRYLCDATEENPKRGFGTERTALWGLQRPPILEGLRTLVRCGPSTTFDGLSSIFLLFYSTNARSQVELSVDGSNEELLNKLMKHDLDSHVFRVVVECEETLEHRLNERGDDFYNIVRVPTDSSERSFPMLGQFVSLYLPLGHIKSTRPNDEEFVKYFGRSEKWLKMA